MTSIRAAETDEVALAMLAHLSAHRRLLIRLFAAELDQRGEPLQAIRELRAEFAENPTQPPCEGSGLDPASSDLLAAMADEAIDDLLARVECRLRLSQSRPEALPPTRRPAPTDGQSRLRGWLMQLLPSPRRRPQAAAVDQRRR